VYRRWRKIRVRNENITSSFYLFSFCHWKMKKKSNFWTFSSYTSTPDLEEGYGRS